MGRPPAGRFHPVRARVLIGAAAVAACLAVTTAALAALPGGARYTGTTSENHNVTITIASNGKRIRRFAINYFFHCSVAADSRVFRTTIDRIVPDAQGRFAVKGDYTGSGGGDTHHFVASGKVGPKSASGTFKTTGHTLDKKVFCHSDKIHWSATRK